jgi:hypothetical protein
MLLRVLELLLLHGCLSQAGASAVRVAAWSFE